MRYWYALWFLIYWKQGFQNLAQNLISIGATFGCINSTEVLPHKTNLSNYISIVYSYLKEKFTEKNQNIQHFIVTFNTWLHQYTGASYVTITLHYISEGNNFLLSTKKYVKVWMLRIQNNLLKKFYKIKSYLT